MSRLPWKLYAYIGRELVLITGLSLAALTLLYVIITGLQGVNMGLTINVVIAWITESIGYSIYFTLPVSLLVANSLVYGRLVADREYTAVTAAGLSPFQLLIPALAVAGACGIFTLITHGSLLPDAHYAQRNVGRFFLKQLEDLGDQKDGQLPINEEDGRLLYDEVRGGTNLRGVNLSKRIQQDPTVEGDEKAEEPRKLLMQLHADFATIVVDKENDKIGLKLQGVDGRIADPSSDAFREELGWHEGFSSFSLDSYYVEFPLTQREKREGDLRNGALLEKIAEWNKLARSTDDEKKIRYYLKKEGEYRSEYWRRKALALSVVSFGFLGCPIPLALRYRHRLVGLFFSCMIVILGFYPLLLAGETLVVKFQFPAMIALMFGNVVVAAIGAFFLGKVLWR